MCRQYEIYVFIPVTTDDMVANRLDYKLLCCNKVLTREDLLFFGVTHNNQTQKGTN